MAGVISPHMNMLNGWQEEDTSDFNSLLKFAQEDSMGSRKKTDFSSRTSQYVTRESVTAAILH